MCSGSCLDIVKPTVPRPSVEAIVEEPQKDVAPCDEDSEMDCLGDGTECIPLDQLCDGQEQCSNGEDEKPDTCAYYDGKLSSSLGVLAFFYRKTLFANILLSFCML